MSAQSLRATVANNNHRGKDNSAKSILKLRRLILDLINEVESLDNRSLPISDALFSDDCKSICFYDEVERFEIALIKAALKKSNGHQVNAARLLNLNPSTLNAKIKQYNLKHLVM